MQKQQVACWIYFQGETVLSIYMYWNWQDLALDVVTWLIVICDQEPDFVQVQHSQVHIPSFIFTLAVVTWLIILCDQEPDSVQVPHSQVHTPSTAFTPWWAVSA